MSKRDIYEAIYALPDVNISRRRKPLTVPIALLFSSFALFALNFFIASTVEMSNLKSAVVLLAVILLLVGSVLLLVRLNGGADVPYHEADCCYLKREELKFNKDKKAYIATLIAKADFASLRLMKQDGVSAVTVVAYSSPKSGFYACQAFEYVELELRPICDMQYTKGV